MNASQNLLPFPLFHGTSSHYLSAFQPGYTPAPWTHKDVALRLLTDAWDALSLIRHEIPADVGKDLFGGVSHEGIPWMVKNVIEQASGYSNWQHGELYLTPSKGSAVRYACEGARYGGELLTFCKTTIDALARLDDRKAKELTQTAGSLTEFLRGTDRPPIIVQFDDLRVDDLSPESSARDVRKQIAFLTEGPMREVFGSAECALETLGQQTNFRLANGRGIVKRVFEVRVENIDEPFPFALTEICHFNPTE